ncbi:MAG: hypothetical protein QM731_18710 [Chitinophagaceae bacterium]
MDEVKKYLRDRREDLDVEPLPGDHVWQHIDTHTRVVKQTPVVRFPVKWVAAASVVLLVAAATYLYNRKETKQGLAGNTIPVNSTPDTQVVKTAPEVAQPKEEITIEPAPENKTHKTPVLADNTRSKKVKKNQPRVVSSKSPVEAMEENYAGIISYQLKRVNSMPIYAEGAGYFHTFKKQWQQILKDEQDLMEDVNATGLNDNMVDRLITIYQQKLVLLKQLQTEINKMNNRVHKDPAAARRNPTFMNL